MTRMISFHYADNKLSGLISRRTIGINMCQLLSIILLSLFALKHGSMTFSFSQIWQALQGEGPSTIQMIITQWRLPRVIVAITAGAALAVSGAIFQIITRNPLGSPDVIGFSTGAWTGALITTIVFSNNYLHMLIGALMGGLLSAIIVFLLAWQQGLQSFRLIIVGIGVSAILTAINSWLIVTGSLEHIFRASLWGNGSLNGITWHKSSVILSIIIITLLITLLMARPIKIMEMGDEKVITLGCYIEKKRLHLIFCAIVLIAAVVALTGPISFIALAAPQIIRRLTNVSYMPLISSALTGGLLLLLADLIAQHTVKTVQLPVGAVTVSLGGIYLIWLMMKKYHE